jgi:uncharacterized protein involved in response to NO
MTPDTHTPPVLRFGFRPFFLVASLWSIVAILLWLPLWEGHILLPTAFDPLAWHVHEMLFGYAAAVVAGFLLTAIPNWTGRLPLAGLPLAVLVAFWLAGRIAVAFSERIGPEAAALIDLSFPALFLAIVAREILAGRNWRNLPMTAALAALLVANAAMHGEALGLTDSGPFGQRLGLATLILLIGLVGGRVVPSFTRNWLVKRGETATPASFGGFDRAAIALMLAGLLAWTVRPDATASGALLVAAGLVSLVRLARWRGHRTLAEPLVWSLHLGFAWVPVGLLLTGLAPLAGISAAAGAHALGAGAVGAMTLAVMTRATLGHSGRTLAADRATTALYLLVHLAAGLRVAAAFADTASSPLLMAATAAWLAAFGLFVLRYGPLLLVPSKR